MAVSATVTAGKIFSADEVVTISELNKLGTPTVDISGAVGALSLADGSVTNAKIQAATGIQYDKLETLATGELVVGNAGTATATALSGDATIAAGGAITIANDAVTTVKILDDNVTTAKILDANVTTAKILDNNVTLAKLDDGTQGDVLYYGASGAPARLSAGTDGQVLESGGAGANPSWANTGPKGMEVFTADGTFTVPAKVTSVKVTVVGGGGGGRSESNPGSQGGGGAGGATIEVITGLVPAADITVTVGDGGAVNTDGGDSSFGGYSSATGGAKGASFSGGAGGVGSGGDINFTGQSGGEGFTNAGGAAFGGNSLMGFGGRESTGTQKNAVNYGGGGAGSHDNTASYAGTGSGGIVIVEY